VGHTTRLHVKVAEKGSNDTRNAKISVFQPTFPKFEQYPFNQTFYKNQYEMSKTEKNWYPESNSFGSDQNFVNFHTMVARRAYYSVPEWGRMTSRMRKFFIFNRSSQTLTRTKLIIHPARTYAKFPKNFQLIPRRVTFLFLIRI
jgi:hypothetical protein